MSRPRIVVVGSSNTDLVVAADRLPRPGETVLGSDLLTAAGGKGANQAVAAARLGAEVALVARVGSDAYGEGAVGGLRAEGIDTSFIVRDPQRPSGVALIVVGAEGENLIAVAPGANAALAIEDVEAAGAAIAAADSLLIQLEVPLPAVRRAVRIAAAAGTRVILDPAPAAPLEPELLRQISVATPNEIEAEALTGIAAGDEPGARRAAERLLELGVGAALVTRGSEGCLVRTSGRLYTVDSPSIEAVDTTAAGDTFAGALACELGSGADLERAVGFACAAAALSATRRGAQPSMPSREEVAALLDGI